MVSRRAADAGVAVTKARGDAARARPAEAAGRVPGRADLRAAGARLGHRVGERDGRDDRALLLLAVDIGDIGHDISLAERALGDHALVALIHGRIAHVVHVIVDVLDIVLPLGDLDGQIRHGVRERQRIADVDAVDVVAGVQRFELGGGHAVVVGDLAPGVALDDGVGHLARLRRIQDLGDLAEVHHAVGRDVALRDADIFDKVDAQRIRRGVDLLDLLEQLVQRAGVLRRTDELIVDIERVAVGHLAELVGEVLLEGRRIRHIAAADESRRIMDGILCDLVGLAERLGRDALELGGRLACLCGTRDGVDHAAVILYGRSQRVEREKQRDRSHDRRAADKVERIHAPRLPAPAVLVLAGSVAALAAVCHHPFMQQRAPHREHPADDEKDLHQKAVGFREVARPALAHDRAGAWADAADARTERGKKQRHVLDPAAQPLRHAAAPARPSSRRGIRTAALRGCIAALRGGSFLL